MLRISLLLLAIAAIACQASANTDEDLINKLYYNVVLGDYESAVADTLELASSNKGVVVRAAVMKLIIEEQRNLMLYAYKVYLESADVIKELFPLQFRMMFEESFVKLIYKRDNLAMKLGYDVDSDGDRVAYGDGVDKSSQRVAWQLKPVLGENKLSFKIMSVHRGEFLKVGVATDSDGDHNVYSSLNSDTNRHLFNFQPAYKEGEFLFFIYSEEYGQALKLGRYVDRDGDRQVYSHNGNVSGSPDLFGWYIKPY